MGVDDNTSTAPVQVSEKTDQNEAYTLKVKQEFIVRERPKSLRPLSLDDNDNGGGGGGGDSRDQNSNKKQQRKKGGRNKKRPRDVRQDNSEKICLAAIRGQGETCPYGDKCRFSHDLKAFMATRPTDIVEIEGGCPIFHSTGYCVYGATCRVGNCHITKTGENVSKQDVVTPDFTSVPLNDQAQNLLPKEVQIQLRKRSYPFKCKRHFEKKQEEKKQQDDKKNNDKNTIEKEEKNEKETDDNKKDDDDKPKQEESMNVVVEPKKDDKETTETLLLSSKPNSFEPLETPQSYTKKKIIDFSNKVYVAPLTTVGNLPFRRIVKRFGADITCGEMAVATNLLEGKASEWALLKRHPEEDVFGVQLAAAHADQFTRVSELIENYCNVDFVDINLGCPLDIICSKGAGSALMMRDKKLKGILEGMTSTLSCPVTVKMRTGWDMTKPFAHQLIPKIQSWGIDGLGAIMIHGRSRLQRYQRLADWDYIEQVARAQSNDIPKVPLIGNGDIFSFTDYEEKITSKSDDSGISHTAMLARGALIKPWLPTEIKERRHWDISSKERLDILKDFVKFGLEHWGSDQQGVNNCRRFLLEWLSFLYRYVPVGLLECPPQQMNQRPPAHMVGRDDLETLFMSPNSSDWIQISEMLLGPVPEGFKFQPKHKANGYA